MKKWQLVSQVWTHISDRSIGGAPWRSWHLCPFYSTPVTHPTMRCLCLLAHRVPKSEEKKALFIRSYSALFAQNQQAFLIFLFQKEQSPKNTSLLMHYYRAIIAIFFQVLIIIGNQGRLRNLNGHQNHQHQFFGI